MSVSIKDIYSQFTKDELLEICQELEIKATTGTRAVVITEAILDNLDEEGVPEIDDELSDLLFEFLVAAEFIDEDGNLLEDSDEGSESEEEKLSEEIDTSKIPCFTFADSRDPSCNRCKAYDLCTAARIANRPACFGLLFDRNAEECKACIEAPFCQQVMTKKEN